VGACCLGLDQEQVLVLATEWAMANKVKTGLGLVVTLAAVVVLPISFVAWAEDQTAEQVKESEIRQQARSEVIYDAIRNKHAYDFFGQEANAATEDLVELEQQEAEGVTLLPSQVRQKTKLVKDIERYEAAQEQALDRLSNPEVAEDASE